VLLVSCTPRSITAAAAKLLGGTLYCSMAAALRRNVGGGSADGVGGRAWVRPCGYRDVPDIAGSRE